MATQLPGTRTHRPTRWLPCKACRRMIATHHTAGATVEVCSSCTPELFELSRWTKIRGWGKRQLAYAEIDMSTEDQLIHAMRGLEISRKVQYLAEMFRAQGTTSGTQWSRNGLEITNTSTSYDLREMVLRHESNANRKPTPFITLTSDEGFAL